MTIHTVYENAHQRAKNALGAIRRSWEASSPWEVAFRAWLACWGPWTGVFAYEGAINPSPGWGFHGYGVGLYLLFSFLYMAWFLLFGFDTIRFWKKSQKEWEHLVNQQSELITRLVAENYALKSGLEVQEKPRIGLLN